jgi:hypothetical protein
VASARHLPEAAHVLGGILRSHVLVEARTFPPTGTASLPSSR